MVRLLEQQPYEGSSAEKQTSTRIARAQTAARKPDLIIPQPIEAGRKGSETASEDQIREITSEEEALEFPWEITLTAI